MSFSPVSPKAARLAMPSWLDGRLVAGILLVLVSVVAGARLLSSADASQAVWVATRDLAPGSTLTESDLERGRVRLYDNGARYLIASGVKPLGYVLTRGVGADELLPKESLGRPDQLAGALRDVSLPVAPGHLPDDLRAGQQVDVYVTAGRSGSVSATGTPAAPAPTSAPTATTSPAAGAPAGNAPAPAGTATGGTRLVLAHVTVALRPQAAGIGGTAALGVVLSVVPADAPALVAAAQSGGVDLVRVPRLGELSSLPAGP